MESNILEKYLENHVLNSWTADSAFMFGFFYLIWVICQEQKQEVADTLKILSKSKVYSATQIH